MASGFYFIISSKIELELNLALFSAEPVISVGQALAKRLHHLKFMPQAGKLSSIGSGNMASGSTISTVAYSFSDVGTKDGGTVGYV